ncbi:hypothetical protein [Nocardioides albus]|uniref:Uncharacterized protein n=1 Tax=Nocardioides albus TaxID=1841 RepID=A0A7W5FA86_9ACTN|nr:hypothetical protein [Nocardioides albus]MBB3091059.1 hypothetical protein [Nocardioides albus]GGU34625.1 hypothetical protein GCM10007979_37260 [Nocardioides albus]
MSITKTPHEVPTPRLAAPSRGALTVACAVTTVLAVIASVRGEAAAYAAGFAPPWVAVVACALGVAGVALPARHSASTLISWTGVTLLSWAAAGLVFDIFRAAAVLGVPGLPPLVDWLGLSLRAMALTSGVLLAAATLRRADRLRRPGRGWVVAAWLCAAPYPLLKAYWWAGGGLAAESSGHPGSFPYGEVVAFGLAAVWATALAMPVRSSPARALLVAGGWFAAAALLNLGALAAFGTLADVLRIVDGPISFDGGQWVVTPVYASWLALGIVLGRLSLAGPPPRGHH